MLITNPGKPITVNHWYMLELRSEKTSEETIKRLGKALKERFRGEEAQIFVPVIERDLDTFTLLTECYVFVKADDVYKVAKLRQVTGVQCVVAHEESFHPSKFLKVEDTYVHDLIQKCWNAYNVRSSRIHVGSWVRLLDGQTRNYCGLVLAISGDRALVRIDLKTKILSIETSIHNLLDLSHVPEAHRVFYYSDPVKTFLADHGREAEILIRQDLHYSEEDALHLQFPKAPVGTVAGLPPVQRHASREQTPTRFVKSLLEGGERDVQRILALTAEAIKRGTIRAPKHSMILWHIIRGEMVRVMIPATPSNPNPTYTDLMERYGERFKLTPNDVHQALPSLPCKRSAPRKTRTVKKTQVTVLIRRSLERGDYDLTSLIEKLIVGIKAGVVHPPKHTESFANIIRHTVLRHFHPIHPKDTVIELSKRYGPDVAINVKTLREKFPDLEALLASLQFEAPLKEA